MSQESGSSDEAALAVQVGQNLSRKKKGEEDTAHM